MDIWRYFACPWRPFTKLKPPASLLGCSKWHQKQWDKYSRHSWHICSICRLHHGWM